MDARRLQKIYNPSQVRSHLYRADCSSDAPFHKADEAERIVAAKIRDLGYSALRQRYHAPYDILVCHKWRIDVKSSFSTNGIHKFKLEPKTYFDQDFFILYFAENDGVFTIPTSPNIPEYIETTFDGPATSWRAYKGFYTLLQAIKTGYIPLNFQLTLI